MPSPTDRRYLDSHEWHKAEGGGLVAIGISRRAVDELTDITFVDVPDASKEIKAGESFGEVESVKATSELYCGIDGRIMEVNGEVLANPALINEDCYERGWIIRVQPKDPAQLNHLMAAADYDKLQS